MSAISLKGKPVVKLLNISVKGKRMLYVTVDQDKVICSAKLKLGLPVTHYYNSWNKGKLVAYHWIGKTKLIEEVLNK